MFVIKHKSEDLYLTIEMNDDGIIRLNDDQADHIAVFESEEKAEKIKNLMSSTNHVDAGYYTNDLVFDHPTSKGYYRYQLRVSKDSTYMGKEHNWKIVKLTLENNWKISNLSF